MRRYDCDRCRDTGQDGDRRCYKCDAHDLKKPDLIQLILDEAVRVEPVRCDQCGHLTEWVHFGDCGMVCADCCLTRPEWAVETFNVAGEAVASIGTKPLGLLGVPYCSPGVDAAVSRLLDEVAA